MCHKLLDLTETFPEACTEVSHPLVVHGDLWCALLRAISALRLRLLVVLVRSDQPVMFYMSVKIYSSVSLLRWDTQSML